MEQKPQQPTLRRSRVRRWITRLWREWTIESWRSIAPAFAKPRPAEWDDTRVTAAWLGHATVLINFFGIKILTDPVLFPRIGIRIPFLFTIGPKRLTAPALTVRELPKIDIILLSHAHFDHIDTRTLHRLSRRSEAKADFDRSTKVITAPHTSDLLRSMKLRDITELRWGDRWGAERKGSKQRSLAGGEHPRNQRKSVETSAGKSGRRGDTDSSRGEIDIVAVRVKHWGARAQRDDYRGYNGYLLERNGRRILFGGDTAFTDSFADLRDNRGIDLAIMSIGAYNPWIRSHCNPEQAVQMANDAGARFIMPVHHQTFRLSFEPFREPIERFAAALRDQPERIALREIGETFVLPL